jgi:hypothetical protein
MKKQIVFGLLGVAFFACGDNLAESTCGDGLQDPQEQCDDANTTFTARISGTINGQSFTREWLFTTE